MGTISITLGFTDAERTDVGALYWQAFERKLRPAFAGAGRGCSGYP